MQDEKLSLNQRLEKMEEVLNLAVAGKKVKQPKEKAFTLPFGMEKRAKTATKSGKVLVLYLKTNRTIVPLFAKVKNNVIIIGEKMYDAGMAYYYMYRGKIPAIVIKEWDLVPIGTKDYYEAVQNKTIVDPQNIIIRAIEMKENLMNEKKMNWKFIVIILGALAVGYYIFFGGK